MLATTTVTHYNVRQLRIKVASHNTFSFDVFHCVDQRKEIGFALSGETVKSDSGTFLINYALCLQVQLVGAL